MFLDLYDKFECHESNEDLMHYADRYGVLNYEIAELLDMKVSDWWLLLTEPLSYDEKMYIAKLIRRIHDIHYRKDLIGRSAFANMRKKYVPIFRAHCCLLDFPVYTGQGHDYYEGRRAE